LSCKDALEQGAVFLPPGEPGDTAHFIVIYERRARHVADRGIDAIGFDDAVNRLQAVGGSVRIGQVHTEQFNYAVFVDAADPIVVACLGVDASVANPDWDYSDWSH